MSFVNVTSGAFGIGACARVATLAAPRPPAKTASSAKFLMKRTFNISPS